jgi:hypothetical protein
MSPAFKRIAIVSLALVAMSCNPRHHDSQQQQQSSNANTAQTAGPTENGPSLRIACADDIQKYCANDPHKRRCLRDNMDKLGDACKTAVNTPRNPANGRRPGIGRLCADDIQKFCANDPHKFRCLKDNLGQLGDACKAAVNAPRDPNPQQRGGQPANGNP